MDAAMVLAVVAGGSWAINIVLVRWALDRKDVSGLVGAFVGIAVAAVVALTIAVLSGQSAPSGADIWHFALVGAIAPGSSQGLFVASIALIGPSRSSALVGTTPMFSVLLAIAFLGEGWSVSIVLGTLLTVAGGVVIGWQRGDRLVRLGALLALATALTFGFRNVVASHFGSTSSVSSWWAGAVVLSAAAVILGGFVLAKERASASAEVRRALPEFVASGVTVGVALPVLLEALGRGQVSVVAPLSNAAQSVVVVVLGAALFGATERAARVIVALALILVGGTIIAAA